MFLSAWRAVRPELPAVMLEPIDHGPAIDTRESIAARCDRGHPLSNLIYKTASYAAAAYMLAGIGTPEFTRWSIELYGRPDEVYKTQSVTGLDAAEFMLDTTDRLCGGRVVPETESTIPAEEFAVMMRAAIDAFFTDDEVAVQLDPDLPSKAIAGSKRVRLRANAMFSDLDFDQLRNHEAFVHTATMINGQRQPTSLAWDSGRSAPRARRKGSRCRPSR